MTNYVSIDLGGVSCVGGAVSGCVGAGISTSNLGEVLTNVLVSENVANDPIQKTMMNLIPSYIDNKSKKAITDLSLGGYNIKDIHKIPQAEKKTDAIVNSQ